MQITKDKLNIAVIGGGGREHAIIRRLAQSRRAGKIYALPGNGGISREHAGSDSCPVTCTGIAATDLEKIVDFVLNNEIDFAAVIPDDPLVMGLCDMLREKGIPCFGPSKAAAIIEGSKAFSKELMKKYGIPTAEYKVFSDADAAAEYAAHHSLPVVVKADGLALGKGVIIAKTHEEAVEAVNDMMRGGKFGRSGATVVVEEFLTGPEVSVLAFTDGKTVVPLPSSMDHKRAGDGDTGLNTGGMGVIAPNPFYTKAAAEQVMQSIILPTLNAMNAEGRTFRGCLYFGLMLTPNGPRVIEYNCRFGDPETQAVLPLVEGDLLEIMIATQAGTLDKCEIKLSDKSSCCLVLASGGYPEKYEKGKLITFDGDVEADCGVCIFHAGTKLGTPDSSEFVTSGGRVAVRDTLEEAVRAAYAAAERVHFDGKYSRSDIGLSALRESRLKNG